LVDDADFAEEVMKPLFAIKDTQRWRQMADDWFSVDHLQRTAGATPRWVGAIQRSRSNEHPQKSGPTVGTSPLNLRDDEGVASHVAFLYDETKKLLWLQRDRSIIGKLDFSDYLRIMTNVSFGLTARLRDDSVARAKKLKRYRGIDFAFVQQTDAKAKSKLAKLLSSFGHYGAYRIEVSLTPVRGGTLNPDAREVVNSLAESIEADDGEVTKAHIKGRIDEDDEDMLIDLIRDKQRFSIDIARARTRTAPRLMAAVERIWSDNRSRV
jgi:hypothetical protein